MSDDEISLEDLRDRVKEKEEKPKELLVWDTSGIINSNELPKGYTVPEVKWELNDVNKFRTFSLTTEEPSDGAIREIEQTAAKLKEHVSDTDIKVLALALDKNAMIRTDDNGIQNIASYLDISFKGNFFNIKTERTWGLYCDPCSSWREGKVCFECGNMTRRRPKKDKKI